MAVQKENYQKKLDKLLQNKEERGKSLFLHSCCAPCSSYCMEYLREYYRLTVFYFNPNITEDAEYRKRVLEEKKLIEAYNRQLEEGSFEGMRSTEQAFPILMQEGDYLPETFFQMAKGLEACPEGGSRCFGCYELRLRETAKQAALQGFDYFATTLTISPLKNAEKLNEIGLRLGEEYGITYLPTDFKKKEGYKRSIELSEQFGLYRQNYCGCVFSKPVDSI